MKEIRTFRSSSLERRPSSNFGPFNLHFAVHVQSCLAQSGSSLDLAVLAGRTCKQHVRCCGCQGNGKWRQLPRGDAARNCTEGSEAERGKQPDLRHEAQTIVALLIVCVFENFELVGDRLHNACVSVRVFEVDHR